MHTDAEQRQEELEGLNEATGALFKIRHDPRITRVGGILRRYSLDELPQLVNVLRGDMSMVGPRPLPMRDYERLEDWHRKRYLVLPGITGLWQVSGRAELDFDELVRLDFLYLERWSVFLDLSILLKTLPAVFRRKGAFLERRRRTTEIWRGVCDGVHHDIWRRLPASPHEAHARLRRSRRVARRGRGEGGARPRLRRRGARRPAGGSRERSSPESIPRRWRSSGRARRIPTWTWVAAAEDGRLPVADALFDVVTCVHVLQHVADTQTLMSEARRVLVSGGLFVVAVPFHGRLQGALIALTSFERHFDPLEPVLRFYTPARCARCWRRSPSRLSRRSPAGARR